MNIKFIKAMKQWVDEFGDEPAPPVEELLEWHREINEVNFKAPPPDCVIDYSDADVHDELNELDSYNKIEYIGEDRSSSQELALEFMEEHE